jgi:enoyl-CoA hydratase/carnithine racemase
VPEVSVEVRDHIAVVTMHRPPANFFDVAMVQELAGAFERLGDDGCRVAVLASEGKHFCAGANFGKSDGLIERDSSTRMLYREALRLFRLPMPVIAAVQGAAVGGGMGLACAADFRVTVAGARFHANFAALAIHQGFALSATLPRLVGRQRATEIFYTARKVSGAEAVAMGLADRLAPDADPLPEAISFAREIAASSPLAVRSMKQTLRAGLIGEVVEATEREAAEQSRLWKTEDSQIGIAANLARETPTFLGR